MTDGAPLWRHATTIALPCPTEWRALMITGASGSGKSELALRLIALGARLVADDQTRLWRVGAQVLTGAADPIAGRIEMRGIGILTAPHMTDVPLAAIVDLDQTQTRRLPDPDWTDILGYPFALLRRVPSDAFAAALMVYMQGRHWDR